MRPSNIDQRIVDAEMCVTRLRMHIVVSREDGFNTDADEATLTCILRALAVHREYKRFLSRGRAFGR